MQIKLAETVADIDRCFPVMVQLRPHLTGDVFREQVQRQMREEGYRLASVEDGGGVQALAGFRLQEMLSRGRFMYVDDLVTDAQARSRGYGAALFEWLVDYARAHGCRRLNLDSGVQRAAAHRFYFRQRMQISAYHFTVELMDDKD